MYYCITEDVITWSINLASHLNALRRQNRQEPRSTTNPHPGTVLQPRIRNRSRSAGPLPPRTINQANPSEPVFPSISVSRFYRTAEPSPPPQEIRVDLQSSHTVTAQEGIHQIATPNQGFHPYLPEEIYVSSVIPTRTPRELRHFQNHCRHQYEGQEEFSLVYDHGINRIHQITTSALHFNGLLWKSKITLSTSSITEYYCYIRRLTRPGNINRVNLEPAFQVQYPWEEFGWTVSRLSQHPAL